MDLAGLAGLTGHELEASRDESRRAVPMIIEGLKAKGFRFVTVPELLAGR